MLPITSLQVNTETYTGGLGAALTAANSPTQLTTIFQQGQDKKSMCQWFPLSWPNKTTKKCQMPEWAILLCMSRLNTAALVAAQLQGKSTYVSEQSKASKPDMYKIVISCQCKTVRILFSCLFYSDLNVFF